MMLIQSCYITATVKLQSVITHVNISLVINLTAIQPRICTHIGLCNSWKYSRWITLWHMLSVLHLDIQ